MSNIDAKLQSVLDRIDSLFSDRSVDLETTKSRLEAIVEKSEMLLEAISNDLRDRRDRVENGPSN